MSEPRFRLSDLDLDFVSLVLSGDDPMARVVLAKSAPVEKMSSRSMPDLERVPGKQNWVDKAGGLPDFIERIAKHLHYEKGMDIGHAIATAVNQCRKWAAGGKDVNADTRAKAAKAIAEWEAKKAKSHVEKKNPSKGTPSLTLSATRTSEEALMGSEINKDDLDPEVAAYIDALESTVTDLNSTVEKAQKDLAEKDEQIAKMAPKDAESSEEITKSLLSKADPAVRALIEKQQADLKEATEIAKAERDARLNREFISKAEALPALAVDPSDFGQVLRRMAEALDPQDVEKIDTVLKSANEAIRAGAVFSVSGRAGADTTVSASVLARAEEIRKADPTLTPEQAQAKAYQENPALLAEALTQGQEV